MAPATKKRKLNGAYANGNGTSHEDPLAPVTPEERASWPGFCEIESNPAFFNVMLKDFGVKDVKVVEVFGLDDDLIAMLPQPVHGLIFLYRYRSDDDTQQEATCPENVWFANQISDFSCATVSLLNIINNIPDADLGEHLTAFKDFTKPLTPYLRGDAIANFQFVKSIHNSFTRKMDMLNTDLGLQNQYDDRNKPKKNASPAKPKPTPKGKGKGKDTKKKSSVVTDEDYEDNSNGYHFSAYVPVDGEVWKLDGLDRQPRKVGSVPEGLDWMSVVGPAIQAQMDDYEAGGGLEYSLLGVVADPLGNARKELAVNIKSVRIVQARLDTINQDWRAFGNDGAGVGDADAILDVSDELIDAAEPNHQARIANEELCPEELVNIRRSLVDEQRGLRAVALAAINDAADEEKEARARRDDFGPVIRTWLTMLAEKEGLVRELIEDLQ